MFKRCCYGLLIFEGLLGVAHLLWPEYQWGQGRRSYFNFSNSLTLASWLASMQLVAVAVLALIGFHRERLQRDAESNRSDWIWLAGALISLVLSFAEMTRFHHRLNLLGYPNPGIYEQFVVYSIWLILLALFGWFLLHRLRYFPGTTKYCVGWVTAWGLELFLTVLYHLDPSISKGKELVFTLLVGWAYLSGITLLLISLGAIVLRSKDRVRTHILPQKDVTVPFPEGSRRIWILLGVGGTAFAIIFLQIILFQTLTIFSDYLTAHSVISIALLGISVGGLVGFGSAGSAPLQTMIGASLLLPVSILAAFGTTVSMMGNPLPASILLTFPFICGGTVITIALVRARTHRVYFIDLTGAALGALLVCTALGQFREENSLLFLCGFTFLIPACFIIPHPSPRLRTWLMLPVLAGALGFLLVGDINLKFDRLNIVRTKVLKRYPLGKLLFSRSSFVGRYDILQRRPGQKTLKALENGRIIDTIMPRPQEEYHIDPRLPHTLMKDPVILILGLSGDGITKTAKALGKKVYGVEINPAIVSLQTYELAKYNAGSYKNIEVTVMDGRSFVEKSGRNYDIITLMNAHFARGRTNGRAPSPEYLHTREAFSSYLRHLTDRGAIVIEEVINRPDREPPVWKLLVTMRQTLLDHGYGQPERHFFIFQWKTKRNNYIQILMKKNPLTNNEIDRLKRWIQAVDRIKEIESGLGRRMGPIRAITTLLYAPGDRFSNNFARILRGDTDEYFLRAHNLNVTTDDRPFHFDVNPAHPVSKAAYGKTWLMIIPLLPFFLFFLMRRHSQRNAILPYISVAGLTGVGYFLIEVVLIQQYEIFLGSPIVTFSSVLGTLLIFSGLGSLWSGSIESRGIYFTLGVLLFLLIVHQLWIPSLFASGAALPMHWKVAFTILSLAPLAFFMGVVFPFVLRHAKKQFSGSTAALLFALNAATSALAVPLSLNLALALGLRAVFQIALFIYALAGISLIALHKNRLLALTSWSSALFLVLILASPQFVSQPFYRAGAAQDPFRVYAASYGNSLYREDRVIKGGSASKTVALEWMFWIIRKKDRTILVDTGFYDYQKAEQWGIRNYVHPMTRMDQLAISPKDVSDIILTHAHWDHMGNLAPYRNSKIWIQETEYQHMKSMVSEKTPHVKGMRWRDLQLLKKAENEGRLVRIHGERTLMPGITLTLDGSHTPGSQYVTVETPHGPLIIAGDTTYLYKNNRRHIPVGSAWNHHDNLRTIRKLHREAASPFYILPGHDPRVMKWFPRKSGGIVEITTLTE